MKLDEFFVIEKYFKPLATNKAAQNLSDDAAKISLKTDEELVVSKDMMVEDVHFLKSDKGYNIAAKLLRTNLSDLAASGATPLYYMLGFSKTRATDEKFVKEFAQGLKDTQQEFRISLIGGDSVNAQDKLFFSITIFGKIKKGQILSRKNAQNGDLIFVSGNIGDAYLARVMGNKKFLSRHLLPTPRIKLGQTLVKNKLSKCAIDVSDGLLADLQHICNASNLSADIFADKIPISDKTANILDLISAGDDYELIFSAKKQHFKKILSLSKSLDVKISCIGYFKEDKKNSINLFDSTNNKINFSTYGYRH